MHDDVIDLCMGMALYLQWHSHTRASQGFSSGVDIIAQAIPEKYNYRYVGIACHNVSVCH